MQAAAQVFMNRRTKEGRSSDERRSFENCKEIIEEYATAKYKRGYCVGRNRLWNKINIVVRAVERECSSCKISGI